MNKPITLMDVSSTSELQEFKKHVALADLLNKEVGQLTFNELTKLSNSEIYCSLAVSIHDELTDRVDEMKLQRKEVANG